MINELEITDAQTSTSSSGLPGVQTSSEATDRLSHVYLNLAEIDANLERLHENCGKYQALLELHRKQQNREKILEDERKITEFSQAIERSKSVQDELGREVQDIITQFPELSHLNNTLDTEFKLNRCTQKLNKYNTDYIKHNRLYEHLQGNRTQEAVQQRTKLKRYETIIQELQLEQNELKLRRQNLNRSMLPQHVMAEASSIPELAVEESKESETFHTEVMATLMTDGAIPVELSQTHHQAIEENSNRVTALCLELHEKRMTLEKLHKDVGIQKKLLHLRQETRRSLQDIQKIQDAIVTLQQREESCESRIETIQKEIASIQSQFPELQHLTTRLGIELELTLCTLNLTDYQIQHTKQTALYNFRIENKRQQEAKEALTTLHQLQNAIEQLQSKQQFLQSQLSALNRTTSEIGHIPEAEPIPEPPAPLLRPEYIALTEKQPRSPTSMAEHQNRDHITVVIPTLHPEETVPPKMLQETQVVRRYTAVFAGEPMATPPVQRNTLVQSIPVHDDTVSETDILSTSNNDSEEHHEQLVQPINNLGLHTEKTHMVEQHAAILVAEPDSWVLAVQQKLTILIENMSTGANGRWSNAPHNSPKLNHLNIIAHRLQTDPNLYETEDKKALLDEILAVCQQKRHSWNIFWQPHSVSEFHAQFYDLLGIASKDAEVPGRGIEQGSR